jgi:hypothetical protein
MRALKIIFQLNQNVRNNDFTAAARSPARLERALVPRRSTG